MAKFLRREADRLLASLNQVEEAASRRECEQAQAAAGQLTIEADSVDVEGAISQQLAEGSEQVKDLVESEVCAETGTTDQAGALGEETTTTSTRTTRPRRGAKSPIRRPKRPSSRNPPSRSRSPLRRNPPTRTTSEPEPPDGGEPTAGPRTWTAAPVLPREAPAPAGGHG